MAYDSAFIEGYQVPVPWLTADQTASIILDYTHHSILLNPTRKFAVYSASNIDGLTWQPIERTGDFVKDDQRTQACYQWGQELYRQMGIEGPKGASVFDQGHLTAFQEVLWGNYAESRLAGQDTFFYTNCVPQHSLLNRGAWRSLEQYIIRKGGKASNSRLCVLTGPVLQPNDPWLTETINGERVCVPCSFWKVIYYLYQDQLNAVGFMMSHKHLLLEADTITFDQSKVRMRGPDIFMLFPKASTYQVNIELIQEIAGLQFAAPEAIYPYTSKESTEVIYKRIEVGDADNKVAHSRGSNNIADADGFDPAAPFDLEGIIL
ncbi:MAG: DNA/RNA non-specific endonuclease [Chitinophagaceae bacterium]